MRFNNPDLCEPAQSLKHSIYDGQVMNVRLSPSIPKKARLLRVFNLTYPRTLRWPAGRSPQGPNPDHGMQQLPGWTHKREGIYNFHIRNENRNNTISQLPDIGTDLGYTQELLGHTSSRTTEIYTHVSNQSNKVLLMMYSICILKISLICIRLIQLNIGVQV